MLTSTTSLADWFEAAAAAYKGEPKKVVNWIVADLFRLLNEAGIEVGAAKISPAQLARLVELVDSRAISGKQAKQVLGDMFATGNDPEAIAAERGMQQISDEGALDLVVAEVIEQNPGVADKVRGGNIGPLGFLVGQVMKKTKGQANPGLVNDLLRSKLVE